MLSHLFLCILLAFLLVNRIFTLTISTNNLQTAHYHYTSCITSRRYVPSVFSSCSLLPLFLLSSCFLLPLFFLSSSSLLPFQLDCEDVYSAVNSYEAWFPTRRYRRGEEGRGGERGAEERRGEERGGEERKGKGDARRRWCLQLHLTAMTLTNGARTQGRRDAGTQGRRSATLRSRQICKAAILPYPLCLLLPRSAPLLPLHCIFHLFTPLTCIDTKQAMLSLSRRERHKARSPNLYSWDSTVSCLLYPVDTRLPFMIDTFISCFSFYISFFFLPDI